MNIHCPATGNSTECRPVEEAITSESLDAVASWISGCVRAGAASGLYNK